MKTIHFKQTLRLIAMVLFVFIMASFDNGTKANPDPTSAGAEGPGVGNESVTGKASQTISHTKYKPGKTGTVEISGIPESVEDFKSLQSQIATEPHGAVGLVLVAMEMYRQDAAIGKQCLELCTTSNVESDAIIRRLKELYGSGSYARPYQVASYFRGATPSNGYNPKKPYTMDMVVDAGRPYSYSDSYESTMIFIKVTCGGATTPRVCYVIKPKGEPYFLVNNASTLYLQVKPIGRGQTFNGF